MRLLFLLLFLVSCGIKKLECKESYLLDVKEYTMQKCMNIFDNQNKCEFVVENRINELRSDCK
jgi:hypothetical protein